MYKFEKNRIIWQILLLWGAWLLINFSLANGFENPERFMRRAVPSVIGFVIIIYFNVRHLLPKYFFTKKHVVYSCAVVFLLTATVLVLHHEIFPWSEWFRFGPMSQGEEISKRPSRFSGASGVRWMRELVPLIIAFLGSTLVEITRFANLKEKEAIRSEKEKLETELKFLKSQVNPHFLFNALNNIYSLAVMQASETPESIMQLSEILRYMVYDSNEELVPLKSEINYIKNFVDLKLLKDSRGMDVQLDVPDHSLEVKIAPLIFIPFVENAFKHSKIEDLREGYVKIKLSVSEHGLLFRVVNSIPVNSFTKDRVGGVGLENIKKQLELLYPADRHKLTIQQTSDCFEIVLKIVL